MQFWALLVDGFREALDRKIFWALVMITLLVVVAMACISFEPDRMTFAFGLWESRSNTWEFPDMFNPRTVTGSQVIAGIAINIMDFFLGWIGTILMIIARADVFPSMMERGAIEVVLSKPMSRVKLFFYKYLASMVFVLLVSSLFVGLTCLVVGARWHVWRPAYLLNIPLALVLFSYIYCITVYVGVRTRSTIASILISLLAWFVCWSAAMCAAHVNANPVLAKHKDSLAGRAIRFIGAIPPKTSDITYIAHRWSGAATGNEMAQSRFSATTSGTGGSSDSNSSSALAIFDPMNLITVELYNQRVSTTWSIGTSLIFEAVVLLMTLWRFYKQDF